MKKIKLTQGKYAIVDDENFEKINQFKWYAAYMRGYWRAVRKIRKPNGKRALQYMHRFIMNCPDGLEVDHRNHNGLNNQKHNLRICTHAENQHNRKLQNGTSKFKGVCWERNRKKWHTQINLNNEKINLGYFINEIAAAKAYDKKAIEIFGKFVCLNFIKESRLQGGKNEKN